MTSDNHNWINLSNMFYPFGGNFQESIQINYDSPNNVQFSHTVNIIRKRIQWYDCCIKGINKDNLIAKGSSEEHIYMTFVTESFKEKLSKIYEVSIKRQELSMYISILFHLAILEKPQGTTKNFRTRRPRFGCQSETNNG